MANKANTGMSSGGKAETTPTTAAPQSRVKVEPPLVEDILRYPIEVFVSTGEAFVPPERMSAELFIHRYYRRCNGCVRSEPCLACCLVLAVWRTFEHLITGTVVLQP